MNPPRCPLGSLLIAAALGLAATVPAGDTAESEEPAVPSSPHAVNDAMYRGGVSRAACSDCHSCDKPTPEAPCLVVCPRHREHFIGAHQADEGPELVIIDQLANLYRPVVFAHRRHANMSAFSGGCRNCHHYSEPSGKIPACRECHDETRHATDLRRPALKGAYHRQCINCHLDWSHENACGFCHEEAEGAAGAEPALPDATDIIGISHPLITAPPTYTYETSYEEGPLVTFHHQDHVDAFGQSCVDCHRGDSCSRCHDSTTSDAKASRPDPMTSCTSCHYERDCGFCHTREARPQFHHTQSVEWPLNPYHQEVACKTCHGEPGVFRTPERRCVSCHIHWDNGGFDHAVTGLKLNEDHIDVDCGDCHADMDFTRTPTCMECHDDPMLPDQLPGIRIAHDQPMIPKR